MLWNKISFNVNNFHNYTHMSYFNSCEEFNISFGLDSVQRSQDFTDICC